MDSVESMKLSKIIKNRKAMTPLMIGIIVAASVLAVFFIVMAATIPLYGRDLDMTIKANTIRGNETDYIQLSFRIINDYEVGILKKVEIYRDSIVYGDNALLAYRNDTSYELTFYKSQEKTVSYNFTVNSLFPPLPPEANVGGLFKFAPFLEYTLRIYFENEDGSIVGQKDFTFTFNS